MTNRELNCMYSHDPTSLGRKSETFVPNNIQAFLRCSVPALDRGDEKSKVVFDSDMCCR